MRMSDPIPTFSRLVTRIRDEHPNFGYIHVVEPRLAGIADREAQEGESNDFLREIWGPRVYIAAGGFTREDAIKTADEKGGLIAYGRYFISNVSVPCCLLRAGADGRMWVCFSPTCRVASRRISRSRHTTVRLSIRLKTLWVTSTTRLPGGRPSVRRPR